MSAFNHPPPPPSPPPHPPGLQRLLRASPRDMLSANDMARLLRHLRGQADESGLQGGALFDGEQLMVLLQGSLPAVDAALQALSDGPPALALEPLVDTGGAFAVAGAGAGQPSPSPQAPWRLAFVEPGLLDADHWTAAGDQSAVLAFFALLAASAGE